MKKTVVDIIYDFMYKMESFGEFNPYHFNTEEVFKKLKEMEQEQIKDAYYEGRVKGFDEGCKYTALN